MSSVVDIEAARVVIQQQVKLIEEQAYARALDMVRDRIHAHRAKPEDKELGLSAVETIRGRLLPFANGCPF